VRVLGLSLVLWFVAASAQAQLFTLREHARQMDHLKVGVGADVNTFFGKTQGAGYAFVQPTLLTTFRVYEAVFEAALPFAYYHENQTESADHDQFWLGNLWFALSFLPDTSCGLSRLSLGIAPGLVKTKDARDLQALTLARAAIGDWDGYLWLDRTLPLVFGASTRKERGMWRLAWDGDVIVGLPGGGRHAEFGVQSAGEFALLFGWRTSLGTRLSAAYYPTLDGDPFQSALTFYLRYARVGDAFGARFVMNLDGPAGFSFTNDGVWGLGLFYTATL
jgi:hypothetical protein